MSLGERWTAHLKELQRQGRYRTLSFPSGVDFSSNDYLGYADLPFRAPEERLSQCGSASRLLRGQHPIWDQVEQQLAKWHQADAALMMTSGYMANEGLLSTLVEEGDWIASDQCNHASIIDGLRLSRAHKHIYRHNDLDDLDAALRLANRKRSPKQQMFIVTESFFGMEGDCAPLEEIVTLAEEHGAHVIVDEAHATGCFGPEGSGLVDALKLRKRVLATLHTGGKALGVPGAYICGSAQLKELLINRCRHFIFTTALAPVIGSWWLETLAKVRSDDAARKSLTENARVLRGTLAEHGLMCPGTHYIVPLILGDDAAAMKAAEALRSQGYDIRAIRPPTVPEGTARLRISIHADHDRATLQRAAAAIAGLTTGRSKIS